MRLILISCPARSSYNASYYVETFEMSSDILVIMYLLYRLVSIPCVICVCDVCGREGRGVLYI